MIRTQQLQLEQMRQYQQDHIARHQASTNSTTSGASASASIAATSVSSTAVADDSTPTSERSFSMSHSLPFPPAPQALPRQTRRNSRPHTGSSGTSPSLHPLPIHTYHDTGHSNYGSGEWPPSPVEIARRNSSRDESAYYQAETATLTRENQMLRLRIRELERQVNELHSNAGGAQALPNTPVTGSSLTQAVSTGHGGRDRAQSNAGPTEATKE